MLVKFVGLTARAAQAIEARRRSSHESESDIIEREWAEPIVFEKPASKETHGALDVGQGIRLDVGETIHLFLSKPDGRTVRPVGSALVRQSGLEVEGNLFGQHRGSYVQKPMQFYQERHEHRRPDGTLISLSAYKHWHAVRDGKLVSLNDLKDPSKARRRRASADSREGARKLSKEELFKLLGIT